MCLYGMPARGCLVSPTALCSRLPDPAAVKGVLLQGALFLRYCGNRSEGRLIWYYSGSLYGDHSSGTGRLFSSAFLESPMAINPEQLVIAS